MILFIIPFIVLVLSFTAVEAENLVDFELEHEPTLLEKSKKSFSNSLDAGERS